MKGENYVERKISRNSNIKASVPVARRRKEKNQAVNQSHYRLCPYPVIVFTEKGLREIHRPGLIMKNILSWILVNFLVCEAYACNPDNLPPNMKKAYYELKKVSGGDFSVSVRC